MYQFWVKGTKRKSTIQALKCNLNNTKATSQTRVTVHTFEVSKISTSFLKCFYCSIPVKYGQILSQIYAHECTLVELPDSEIGFHC